MMKSGSENETIQSLCRMWSVTRICNTNKQRACLIMMPNRFLNSLPLTSIDVNWITTVACHWRLLMLIMFSNGTVWGKVWWSLTINISYQKQASITGQCCSLVLQSGIWWIPLLDFILTGIFRQVCRKLHSTSPILLCCTWFLLDTQLQDDLSLKCLEVWINFMFAISQI